MSRELNLDLGREPHTMFTESGYEIRLVDDATARGLSRATRELRHPDDVRPGDGPDMEYYVRIQDGHTIGHNHYPLTFRAV